MKVTVWNENLHEKEIPLVTELYPGGLHGYIAGFLKGPEVEVRTATLDDPGCGLTEDVLADTDVLVWWGHVAHDRVPDEVVDRVQRHILSGMGLVVLHSGHHSRIFRRMLGTTCNLKWRDNARERLWTVKPNHPIAAGIPETFVLDCEEMYGEPFDIAEPQDFRGSTAGKSSAADAPGFVGMGRSSTSSRGMKPTRVFRTPTFSRSSKTPSGGPVLFGEWSWHALILRRWRHKRFCPAVMLRSRGDAAPYSVGGFLYAAER